MIPWLLAFALLARPAASREALEARFSEIAASAGGTLGVSVLHLESGRGASLHGHERFPMASVFKLPLAIALLERVDRGALRLDQRITLGPADIRPGGAGRTIADRAPSGGLTLSLADLLEAMLVQSDNTAADALLPLAGGGTLITAQLDAVGLSDIRIDRSEAELWLDAYGATPPPRAPRTPAGIRGAIAAVPEAARREAVLRFLADPRDTATPDALVQLLRQVQEGRGLSTEGRERLLVLMTRTQSGEKRLRAGLPAGTALAHRTGSGADVAGINIATNDVGIVTLPGNRGHLAIAVMIKGSDRPDEAREKAIAGISRAAFDYWTR
ncbi:MAG TPA: class A beta-lactamase [Thermoanaerobaculia bacterium]|nr:class A beta-lactamase [Thermoanaerobaculia bacterium]